MLRSLAPLVLVTALAGPVAAQPAVTIALKSGDTLSAQLVDLNASGLVVRANGAERRIPKSDVAVIAFDGTATAQPRELDELGGDHLLVLRNGNTVRGEFLDVGGTDPLRLSFRSKEGDRDYSSADVRRIVLARPAVAGPPTTAPTPDPPPAGGRRVQVAANQRWSSTGITVRRGQRVTFQASGEVELAAGGALRSGPGGTSNTDAAAPMPGTPTGTLIGRVDPGRLRIAANPFAIGASGTVTMPNDGVLHLGVNDGELGDNRGTFEVRIELAASRRVPQPRP